MEQTKQNTAVSKISAQVNKIILVC